MVKIKIYILAFVFQSIFVEFICGQTVAVDEIDENNARYAIEGKVYHSENDIKKWLKHTSISVNSGEYKGFLKNDGTFIISSLPYGSYVVEINNPEYLYEPIRVEINLKGKFRARKVNYVQPSQIIQVPYPLRLKALTKYKYFQTREQWKITDFLFSPMVLMMLLPLILMLILPKMMSDPETKKEMENISFPKMTNEMPEISEVLTSFFTGGSAMKEKEKKNAVKSVKRRN